MADLKQTIIEYMKDFHVEADLTIEELAGDIMADVDEAFHHLLTIMRHKKPGR